MVMVCVGDREDRIDSPLLHVIADGTMSNLLFENNRKMLLKLPRRSRFPHHFNDGLSSNRFASFTSLSRGRNLKRGHRNMDLA